MNTIQTEQNAGKALLDAEQGNSGERIRGIDGWVISVHERDAGLNTSRRFEIIANNDAQHASSKTVTLFCAEDELAGFRLACAEAARAELELTNPLAGLRHYRTAMLAFPFLPGLDVLRDQLMHSAGQVVEAALNTADECLKQRRTWAAATPALERVKMLIEIEDALHVAFGARHALLHSLASRLDMLSSKQRTLTHDEALDLLRGLRDELADDPASYWHLDGWRSARNRLAQIESAARHKAQEALLEQRRQFIADVGHVCNDADASRFLERHAQHEDFLPADESIAQLQLDEAEVLLRRADVLMQLHREHEDAPGDAEDDAMRSAMTLLHDEASKLEGWRHDLQALIGGLNVARHTATLGLHAPAQLEVARYVLSIGGRAPATSLRQVPAMFIGHPSLLQCKATVDECAARRASQEKLFREIRQCLKQDDIETALEKLRAMRRDEPADACGQQQDLLFVDDHLREHRGLPAIEAVVLRKVEQLHALRNWLTQVSAAGVVDWAAEKQHIETLRDGGPAGLTEAQLRCKQVRAGERDGTVNGVWSLQRVCDALLQESMIAHLRQTLGEPALPLCALARALDQQRHALWLAHERNLQECDALARDIASRIARYPAAWDAFEAAYRALMTLPWWRRRRVAHSAEWQQFQAAAEMFHGLCPNDSAFRIRLQEVQERFHLAPAFVLEQNKHERHEEQHA